MGYTKKWIPPTIPLRDNLAAWKTLFQDVHDNLLLAGLVQTATPGQLDIADVIALPADGSYAGFVEYAFDDALQATTPIVIKLEYGCGIEGLYPYGSGSVRSRTPRIRATVTCNGKTSSTFECPQSFQSSGSGTSQLTALGICYLVYNPAQGFFGCVYGAGSRNKPFIDGNGSYYGATLTLFVQRSTDAAGQPTAAGVSLYAPDLSTGQTVGSLWASGVLQPAMIQDIDAATGALPARNDLALRLGGISNSMIGGEIQTQQIFSATPRLKPWPSIVSYNVDDVPAGTEFMLEVFPGAPQNFVALGNETSIGIDWLIGQRGAVAMLFE